MICPALKCQGLWQDVTLTAGFGLPSVAVQQFDRPVPVLDAMHYAYAVSSKCALSIRVH